MVEHFHIMLGGGLRERDSCLFYLLDKYLHIVRALFEFPFDTCNGGWFGNIDVSIEFGWVALGF